MLFEHNFKSSSKSLLNGRWENFLQPRQINSFGSSFVKVVFNKGDNQVAMITELCLVFLSNIFYLSVLNQCRSLYLWNKFEVLTGLRIIKVIYFYFPINLNDQIVLTFIFWNIWVVLTFGRLIFQLSLSMSFERNSLIDGF